ncbi:MAG: DUF4446 family protein [Lachnospiraceae bacterium]|nr:DUF4446 family protein [Lachnospiraceae bacterium]
MNSQILSTLGMGGMDPGILFLILTGLSLIFLIVFIVQGVKLRKLRQRLDKLCAGKDGRSLERKLDQIIEDNQYLLSSVDEHKDRLRYLTNRLGAVYQKSALLKYNAHDKMGGELSFVYVLLDENNNGVMINSVHVSEGAYVYSKVIQNGKSKVELGPEEIRALEQAVEVELPKK